MSEITTIPIKEVLGDPKTETLKVERSWSEDVPASARTPIVDFNRSNAIETSIKRGSNRRSQIGATVTHPNESNKQYIPQTVSNQQHFFLIDKGYMEYVGSKEVDMSKFSKDASGLFLRNWMKKEFPGRKDYAKIATFSDNYTIKELAEMLEMCE